MAKEKLVPAVAMGMTITQLSAHFGWSNRVVEYLALFLDCDESQKPISYWTAKRKGRMPERKAALMMLADTKTLRELLDDVEGGSCAGSTQALELRLKEIGLTALDTLFLSPNTVTFEMLCSFPREELLKYDAMVLGTISNHELGAITTEYGPDLKMIEHPRPTVADLLAEKPFPVTRGRAKTVELLERLGFSPEDGPLMAKPRDPRTSVIESLMNEDGLTAEEAEKFATIAARRNWI